VHISTGMGYGGQSAQFSWLLFPLLLSSCFNFLAMSQHAQPWIGPFCFKKSHDPVISMGHWSSKPRGVHVFIEQSKPRKWVFCVQSVPNCADECWLQLKTLTPWEKTSWNKCRQSLVTKNVEMWTQSYQQGKCSKNELLVFHQLALGKGQVVICN
jgi:hypothetical protein